MGFTCLAPSWFFGYDIFMEFIFFIIALAITVFAWIIYKKTDQRQVGLFRWSFFFIAISYLIQSIFNFLIIYNTNQNICSIQNLQAVVWFDGLGVYSHMIFMTLGLVILSYMTFKTEKKSIFWLLLIISLFLVSLTINSLYLFFLIMSIYLIIISRHFIVNYLKNKQLKTLVVVVAFLFLLFANIHFIFSINHQFFYALGHIFELIAYLLILFNLYLVIKK